MLENVSTCTKIEMMRNALCTHTVYVHVVVVVVVEAGNVSSIEKIIHKVCHCIYKPFKWSCAEKFTICVR